MENLISINEKGIHYSVIMTDEQEAEFNRLMQEGIPKTEALDHASKDSKTSLNMNEDYPKVL